MMNSNEFGVVILYSFNDFSRASLLVQLIPNKNKWMLTFISIFFTVEKMVGRLEQEDVIIEGVENHIGSAHHCHPCKKFLHELMSFSSMLKSPSYEISFETCCNLHVRESI